mmetsp:Transcript_95285/g.188844  ORF Transcript_95285/g.188844 Transcript_95285/m.188844 type:complete len:493 (+) Transcript_95285:77-1555(+)
MIPGTQAEISAVFCEKFTDMKEKVREQTGMRAGAQRPFLDGVLLEDADAKILALDIAHCPELTVVQDMQDATLSLAHRRRSKSIRDLMFSFRPRKQSQLFSFPLKALALFLLALDSSFGLCLFIAAIKLGRNKIGHCHMPLSRSSFSMEFNDHAGSDVRTMGDQGGELRPRFGSSRRLVLSGAVAAGVLWQRDFATAAADPIRTIGEPVISGGQLPLTVGLGMGPPYTQRYVELAIDAGYRLFDTAQEYGSEEGLGNALKAAFASGKLKRKDVFVTTKVWVDNMGYDRTINSVRESLGSLGELDGGIDLVLIHWPCPFVPKEDPGAMESYSKLRRTTWEALEKLQQDGVIKQIGVSNFGARHLRELLGYAKVKPAVDQVEVHPYNQRVGLEKLVKSEGIRFEAYSPLGKGRIGLLEDPVLTSIAATKKTSVAKVILRWLLQRGITPIPLSRDEKRLKENIDVFDFDLSDDEMRTIAKLDRGQFVIMDDEKLA